MKRAINRNTGATAGLVAAMAGVTGAASVASVALAMQPFAPGSAVSPPPTTITFVADGPFILTPQIVSRRHPSMPDRPVRVSNVDAIVSIVEQLATTNLEITLTNSSGRAQEAQIVLPVPEGASVRSFQYDGTGPEPTATLIARDDARRYYESIVNASRDPGLLEFVGLSAIRSSVFPVPAGASQKVRIVYEQVLKANDGRVDYVLPRSDGLAATQTPWSVKVEVKAGKEISSVFSPTHAMV
ncbi:MAG: hypothetical protein K2X32_07635, partial [Phycisphaerales bacterium]|nr:hypothetical protein [Phycisphaerales bacterium]